MTKTVTSDVHSLTFTHLVLGRTYPVSVLALNATGPGTVAQASVLLATVPGAPHIAKLKQGKKGGAKTAVAVWRSPSATGGLPIRQYQVTVYRVKQHSTRVLKRLTVPATTHRLEVKLPGSTKVRYRFSVKARNADGWGASSTRSSKIAPR